MHVCPACSSAATIRNIVRVAAGAGAGRRADPRDGQRLAGRGGQRRGQAPAAGGDLARADEVLAGDRQAHGALRRQLLGGAVGEALDDRRRAVGLDQAPRLTDAPERARPAHASLPAATARRRTSRARIASIGRTRLKTVTRSLHAAGNSSRSASG